MTQREFGIIGLGKFGFSLGRALSERGQIVVGVDADPEKIKDAADLLAHVYESDAMDKIALKQMGFADFTEVIVSTGHSMEASILITLYLKELGCKRVTVKASSRDHEKVLKKVGADEVIFPERYAAEQLAAKLAVPGLLDYLPLGHNVILKELTVERWAGRSLRELNLTNTYEIQVLAVKAVEDSQFQFIPRADRPLRRGDVLAVVGRSENLNLEP